MRRAAPALVTSVFIALVMAACGQGAPAEPTAPAQTGATTGPAATSALVGSTPVATADAHFNPTEAVGGGAMGTNAVSDVASVFAAVQQASQLQITANSNPPGATGANVQSVSILAQDKGGLMKGLDAAGKKTLGDAMLTAAGTTWPNATVSLLVTDPNGGSGQIIGSRTKGGPNTVIAS